MKYDTTKNAGVLDFYDTKSDYDHLLQLLEEGKKVLVFSTHRGNISIMRKVGNFIRFWWADSITSSSDVWDLTPWDEQAVKMFGRQKTFAELCEEYNLHYIEPTK